jgi:hypothetical protein
MKNGPGMACLNPTGDKNFQVAGILFIAWKENHILKMKDNNMKGTDKCVRKLV